MPSIAGLVGPAAITNGVRQSLALARGANPTASLPAGSFGQHLDVAVRSGINADMPSDGLDRRAVTSIEAVRAEYHTATAEFEMHFRRLLREHGIDIGEGIVLEANRQGDVQVVGDHPQHEAIEALFRQNTDLRTLFVQLDQQASLLRAADLVAELSRLQAEAPSDAAAHVQQLLGSSPPNFSLAVGQQDLAAKFS
ncbi:MAG: hypothetical protein WD894_26830 [Pirellulales bacterium]